MFFFCDFKFKQFNYSCESHRADYFLLLIFSNESFFFFREVALGGTFIRKLYDPFQQRRRENGKARWPRPLLNQARKINQVKATCTNLVFTERVKQSRQFYPNRLRKHTIRTLLLNNYEQETITIKQLKQ